MKKKLFALVLVIALAASLAIGLAACNPDDGDGEYNLPALTTETIKIGVLHINPKDANAGYTAAHESGIQEMRAALGINQNQIVYKDNLPDTDTADIKVAIEDLIAEGCNVIIGTSFGYQSAMHELSKEYRNVYFTHGTGYMDNENMNNYFGRIYQARFLSGVVAGLKSLEIKNDKIGYVSAFGTSIAETSSGINAFTLGAQSVNPNVEVNVQVLGSWYDQVKERDFAKALLDAGCGIITQHCDTEGPSDEAKKANAYSVGYNTDMAKEINSESVLTSVVWHWGKYYTAVIEAILDGEWAEFGNYYGEFSDGLYGITELSSEAAEGTADYIALVEEQMMKGAAGRAEWDVFSGKKLTFVEDADGKVTGIEFVNADLVDNNGNVIVAAGGASVADSVITGNMPYFVNGVKLIGSDDK